MADVPTFGGGLLLALESVETKAQYRDWLESLWPSFLATLLLLIDFDDAETADDQIDVVENGLSDPDVNPQVAAALSILAGKRRVAA